MMNRCTLFFQGIFFGKPRCSCFQGYQTNDPLIRLHTLFHRFCGDCKEAKLGGGEENWRWTARTSLCTKIGEIKSLRVSGPTFRSKRRGSFISFSWNLISQKLALVSRSTSCTILQGRKERKEKNSKNKF